MATEGSVVVGIDGSETSRLALAVAAGEAVSAARPLSIVYAYTSPMMYLAPDVIPDPALENELVADAETLLREAAEQVTAGHPSLSVTTELLRNPPAPALLAEAEHASLVVLGSRGLGGFKGLIVGSVTVQVAAHAQCPVLVVPPESAPITGPVITGVDGSDPSTRALGRAFDRAGQLGAQLIAVHAWRDPASASPLSPITAMSSIEGVERAAAHVLSESLAELEREHPAAQVEPRLVRAHAADALLGEARPGAVIVVGSRGRGGFRGLLLGSVSQSILHNATCPVEIVR